MLLRRVTALLDSAVSAQDVKPKLTAHPGQHLKMEAKSSNTIGCALAFFCKMSCSLAGWRLLSSLELIARLTKMPIIVGSKPSQS